MARVVVQFIASSNMGAVQKDLAALNAQMQAMAHQMSRLGADKESMKRMDSIMQTYRSGIADIRGFETAQMSARTASAKLTDDINRQRIAMKDLGKVRANLSTLATEQLRLQDSMAMVTGYDQNGRVMGELTKSTGDYANSARRAGMETAIMSQAMASAYRHTLAQGKQMQWTGRQLSMGLTAPIVGVAAVSAKAAYDIDAAMVRVTKVYGDLGNATKEELQGVRDLTMQTAKDVASAYGLSGKSTVELAASFAAAGFEGEALQSMVKETQRISVLGELDQQKAMEATIAIRTVYGRQIKDLAGDFNFLNAIENTTNTTLQDLTEVIPRTAGVIKDLGGNLQDSAIFTVAFKEAGIDAVQGANALRSSLGAIVAPSGVAQKKLNELGIDIVKIAEENSPENGGSLMSMLQALGTSLDSLTSTDRQKALATLFGRYQFNKMNGLLKSLTENIDDTSTQVGRAFELTQTSAAELSASADKELGELTGSLSGRLRIAAQEIVIAFAEIGRPILAVVVRIVEAFSGMMQFINGLPKGLKVIAAMGLAFLAVVGPLTYIFGLFKALGAAVGGFVLRLKVGKQAFTELATNQSRFAELASTQAIPAINAEAGALERMAAAARTASASLAGLAREQAAAGAGAGAGAAAGRQRMRHPAGATDAQGNKIGGQIFWGPAPGAAAPAPAPAPARVSPAAIGPVGTPGPIISPAAVQGANRELAEQDRIVRGLRGSWTGTAQSVSLMAGSLMMMSGAGGTAGMVLSGLLLTLGLFPGILAKIAASIAAARVARLGADAAGAAGRTGILGRTMTRVAGAFRAGGIASRFFGVALRAMLGPLGWVIAGVAAAVGAFKLYKKSLENTRKEQKAVDNAAASMAETLGFTYQKAGQSDLIDPETGEKIKTIAEKTKEWAKENEKVVDSLKRMNDERLKMEATRIGLDVAQNGGTPEQAREAMEMALRAAQGDVGLQLLAEIDIDFSNSTQVAGEAAKITAERFQQVLNNKFKQGKLEGFGRLLSNNRDDLNAGAKEAARGLGAEFARELDNANKDEVKAAFDRMNAMIDEQLVQRYGDKVKTLGEDQKAALSDAGIDPNDTASVIKYLAQWESGSGVFRDAAGNNQWLDTSLRGVAGSLSGAASLQKEFTGGLLEARGVTGKQAQGINTLSVAQEKLGYNIISLAEAEHGYNDAVNTRVERTGKLTSAQQLQILNTWRAKRGLEAATSVTQGFGAAQGEAEPEVNALTAAIEEQMNAIHGGDMVQGMQSELTNNLNEAMGLILEQYDAATEGLEEALDKNSEDWKRNHDKRKEQSDEEFSDRQKKLNKRQDAEMKALEERQTKAVSAIEKELQAAQKLDDQREKMFQRELTRIQRLSDAANTNIDFNIALREGNLDEAARLMESAYVTSVENSISDAQENMGTVGEQREETARGRIAALEKRFPGEQEALRARHELQEEALAEDKKRADERFKAEADAHAKSLESQKKSLQAGRAEERRLLEESLKDRLRNIPATREAYAAEFGWMKKEYERLTGKVLTETDRWTKLHNSGFQKAFENTQRELTNKATWTAIGNLAANSITEGMLGMSFDDFANWMSTGKMPDPKPAPAANAPLPPRPPGISENNWRAMIGVNHGGGPAGKSSGRAGRPMSAPLYPDEVPTILQKGEYVVQKKAVDKVGLGTLNAINQGRADHAGPFFHEGGLIGAAAMNMTSVMSNALASAIQQGARRKVEELQAQGNYDAIPLKLQSLIGAARAGKYGNSDLSDEQLANAASILNVGRSMGASERDLVIALMTALQESTLRNINYGDRDSLGLFQQRPSMGWGTPQQLTNPEYAARKFFEELLKIEDRQGMSLTQAAQAVQRSAFPDAYAKWEDEARAIIGATGAVAVAPPGEDGFAPHLTQLQRQVRPDVLTKVWQGLAMVPGRQQITSGLRPGSVVAGTNRPSLHGSGRAVDIGALARNRGGTAGSEAMGDRIAQVFRGMMGVSEVLWKTMQGGDHYDHVHVGFRHGGGLVDSIPGLKVGGTVNYDNTIANLHKDETVLTAPLSQKLQRGIDKLDSGANVQYNITVNGAGADAETVAQKVMQKIQRIEQTKGPARVRR